jgi:cation diffusion facilitator CzcD-associated flavoprotein CzcO
MRNGKARSDDRADDFPIVIIGAGFAGIGTAIQLLKAGITSFTMFERAGEIGGTWRDNTYPGAACDVPSHAYSLSFEQSPSWSRKFAESGEIQNYLLALVEKWGIRPHIRFNTEIIGARFDESGGTWNLTTSHGDSCHARVVVSCVGGLVDPALPKIKGLEAFKGELFHTARWNHRYDLTGKRVGVIGTGASAVQVVPAIAPIVGKLHVFQRTPGWVVPKMDKVYSERAIRLFARFPVLLRLSRQFKYWRSEFFGPMIFLDSDRLSAIGQRMSLKHLKAQVRDPELQAKLTPNFQFGCKRILVSDDYWATFNRQNVELVTDPIEEVVPEGIRTGDGALRELDALVLATGFDLGIGAAPFPITGLGGKNLDDVWRDGAVAYKGMAVSGFPNWFILMGPNTGPGHTSVLVYTEAQIAHTVQAIRKLRDERLKYVNVRQDAQDRYNDKIQGRMKYMVWNSGCNSWYLSPDGSNHSLYPGFAAEYVLRARRFKPADYEIVPFDRAPPTARGEAGEVPETSPAELVH